MDCKFIRINCDQQNFDIFVEISKIQNHIVRPNKELTKKSVINDISNKLLNLKFTENNDIKTKGFILIFKKILPDL